MENVIQRVPFYSAQLIAPKYHGIKKFICESKNHLRNRDNYFAAKSVGHWLIKVKKKNKEKKIKIAKKTKYTK